MAATSPSAGELTTEQARVPSSSARSRRRAARQPSSQPTSLPLSRRQPPSASESGIPDGQAVGVRVVGDDQLGVGTGRRREREIHRARFLGVRERDRGEGRIGLELLGDRDGFGEACRLEHASRGLPSDAVQGRVDEADRRRIRHQVGGACDVLVYERLVGGLVRGVPGQVVDRARRDLQDVRLDLAVGRRDDLRPVVAVRRGTPCSRCRRPDCGWPSP